MTNAIYYVHQHKLCTFNCVSSKTYISCIERLNSHTFLAMAAFLAAFFAAILSFALESEYALCLYISAIAGLFGGIPPRRLLIGVDVGVFGGVRKFSCSDEL